MPAIQQARSESLRSERDPTPRSAGLSWSACGLLAASWISAGAFGLYIVGFYLGALHAGDPARWNDNLTGLYNSRHPAALMAIAAHMAAGAVILVLGPVQLIDAVRQRWPAWHRWIGRLYVLTGFVAGVGGLGFIVIQGTIGGTVMNLGFGLYGALMVLAAVETYRQARARRFEKHRIWALRLFALAIGSWLYRMDYGFWLLAMHGLGHLETFRGPFDRVMAFAFYLPNLAVVELWVRGGRLPGGRFSRAAAAALMNAATLIVAIGTYYFLRYYWGPGILHALFGHSA
ncbi:MAG TPA: DUF2306 domain-containing protein [Acidobacteriaceae bacterium]|jgi:hypothetical protein